MTPTPRRSLAQRLAGLEFWFLGLILVASLLWPALLPLAVVLGVIFCFVRWFVYGKPGVRTPADWGNILLLVMAVLSLRLSAFPKETTPQVFRLLAGIALFYAVVNWGSSKSRVGWLIFLLSVTGAGLSLYGLLSVKWVTERLAYIPSSVFAFLQMWAADQIHPNVMAGSLVLFTPLLFSLILFNSKPPFSKSYQWVFQFLYFLSLIGVIGGMALTQSRGAVLGFLVAIIVLITLRWKWGWIFGLALVCVGLVVLARGSSPLVETLLISETLGSISVRIEIWTRAISFVEIYPWTGIGMGAFKYLMEYLMPILTIEGREIIHTHNLFLQVAIDLGLPGLVGWLSVLIVAIAVSWNLYKTGLASGERWVMGLGAGLLCSSVTLVVHGMIDSVVWGLRSAPIVWLFWGITIAAGQVYLRGNLKAR